MRQRLKLVGVYIITVSRAASNMSLSLRQQRDVLCTCFAVFWADAWRLCVGVGSFSRCGRNGALRPAIWKTSAVAFNFPPARRNTGRQPRAGRRRQRLASDWTVSVRSSAGNNGWQSARSWRGHPSVLSHPLWPPFTLIFSSWPHFASSCLPEGRSRFWTTRGRAGHHLCAAGFENVSTGMFAGCLFVMRPECKKKFVFTAGNG